MNSSYKINNRYYCECGKEFDNYQALNGHFGHCVVHRLRIGKKAETIWKPPKGVMCGWSKKSQKEINEIYAKASLAKYQMYVDGKIVGGFTGKHHTEETKQKQRIGMLNAIKHTKGNVRANYNPKSIEVLDKISKDHGWHLQHAENGGEYFIGGYFVDAYDKDLNIVVEYDEPKHYTKSGELKQKDVLRQNNIINYTGCTFYRYNESKKLLYKVN